LRSKRRDILIDPLSIVQIVGDALVASVGVGHGKFIPLLIVDAGHRPEIVELIRIHEFLPSGDVECVWGQLKQRPGSVFLILSFIRPVVTQTLIEFDVRKYGGIVDKIIRAHGLYLQAGKLGDRLMNTPGAPRILMEIPQTDFDRTWESIWIKVLIQQFQEKGQRKDPKALALRLIEEWRRPDDLRMHEKLDTDTVLSDN